MKIRKIFTTTFILGLLACVAVGCSNQEGNGGESPDDLSLSLNYTERTIQLTEGFYLESTLGGVALERAQYRSSNPLAVSVAEDGKVTGEGVGSAEITVSYGEYSSKCSVTVGLGAELPSLSFYSLEKQSVVISQTDSLDLSCFVTYGGATYTDASVSYTLSNEDAGTVVDGKFLPNLLVGEAFAETTVSVNASWKNVPTNLLKREVTVKVISVQEDYDYLTVNGLPYADDVTLYTVDSLEGQTYATQAPFVCKYVKDGEEISSPSNMRYLIEDEGVVTVVGGSLIAQSAGTTRVTVEYFVGDVTYASLGVTVTVVRPVADHDCVIENVSAIEGFTIPQAVMPTSLIMNVIQNEGTDGEKQLTIEGDTVYGLKTSSTQKTNCTVTVYSNAYGYRVKVNGYTKILKTQDDLQVLSLTEKNSYTVDGYYLLHNDIEVDDSWQGIEQSASYAVLLHEAKGFVGTFDGNGKTLTLTEVTVSSRNGVFGKVGTGGVVKNVGITVTNELGKNAFNNVYDCNIVAVVLDAGSTLENTCIRYVPSSPTKIPANVVAYVIQNGAILKDLYVYIDDNVLENKAEKLNVGYLGGSFSRNHTATDKKLYNVRVVCKNVTTAGGAYAVNGSTGKVSTYQWYAENEPTANVPADTAMQLQGLYRYEDVATLLQVSERVGSWVINADGTATYTLN